MAIQALLYIRGRILASYHSSMFQNWPNWFKNWIKVVKVVQKTGLF